MKKLKKLAVFCGSSVGINPVYAEAAQQLAAVFLNF
jgi:predicted Rossmann-fold nucleotide-binding protein